jgi:hypothetical protein
MHNMFGNKPLSVSHYDALLRSWKNLTLQNSVTFGSGNSHYCQGEEARQSIIDNYSWTINDSGKDCSYYISSPDTFTVTSGTTKICTVTINDTSLQVSYDINKDTADGNLFEIDEESGELRFIKAPNYSHPQDNNHNNIYHIVVEAKDNPNLDIQTIRVTVKPNTAIIPIINYLLH